MSSSLTILMTCCAGFSACGDLRARGALLDRGDELPDHRQRDVGLEQGDADLARGGVDVGVAQPALAAQAGEDLVEPVGEGLEHAMPSSVLGVLSSRAAERARLGRAT